MKVKTLIAFAALTLSQTSFAAHYCNSSVEYLASEYNGVRAYTNTNGRTNDPMYIAYNDSQFSSIYASLVRAQSNGETVKIYILEEQDGDDAASCRDGVVDYIGSVHPL
ncbi:hypothetical protein [Pseudoalteromonas xiamenensis]|uniref:Uncharacterized protein n=1 Tax=Pseudoalteromonas xiamenensis TaxID=882626 RepID=A0A975DL93_9GAMM|nr:hypothetical protein [Pseudoalteromonas xiamenensis]QTH73175.1 hypothetical protein J5O05_20470 [Pseudoalteromonas xiamenensis]